MSQPIAAGSIAVPADTLRQWAAHCLVRLDLPAADATRLAESLVQTSLWGVDSHGVARLTHYFDRLSRGSIKARPAMVVKRTGPCTAQLAGDQGHGILVAHRANRLAMEMARENGIGAVGVSASSHCGAMALYTREAARQGLVALAFTHADSIAAAHGGERAFFGTNPISIAFPRDGGEPACLDMATTSIPWNRVMNARREGHALPPDVAIDTQGQPTTDADAAVAVTPLGGAAYGHKGYALALMIDLLCGPLNGNPWGPNIPKMFADLDAPRRIGAFFIVIDPLRFAGGSMLGAAVAQMAQALAAEPGAPEISASLALRASPPSGEARLRSGRAPLMPGDPELAQQRERERSGIPIEPGLAQQMRDWSERLGVAPPL